MDINVRTEATIYLDSEDDEDPLRLSPPPPALSSSNSLRNHVRQRFAQLQKKNMNNALIEARGDKTVPAVALKKIGNAGSKPQQVIEVIDLEDDSSSSNSPKHVPSLPSTPKASSLDGLKNGTDGSKLNLRNGHNVSNHVPAAPSSSKPSNSSRHENTFTVASISKVSGADREEGDLPGRKRHRLHATNQVIAFASTSKECSLFIPSFPSSPKKSKPSTEKDFPKVGSNLQLISLDTEENELLRSEGNHGLQAIVQAIAIASKSKERGEFILTSSPKKNSVRVDDNSPVVASSSNANRLGRKESFSTVPSPIKARPCTEASFSAVPSPTKARPCTEASFSAVPSPTKARPCTEASFSAVSSPTKSRPRTEENFPTVASTSKASRPGREENVPVVLTPSKEIGLGRVQKVTEILSNSKKIKPAREEIDLTMSKLMECNPTNHNIFLKFIEICVACDNSADLKEIHKKKTNRYYENLQSEYKESEMFRSLLEENISIMAKNPAMVFTCLVNVHAEMKRQRVVANGASNHSATNSSVRNCNTPVSSKKSPTLSKHQGSGDPVLTGPASEEDSKEARKREKTKQHIKNLEKALRQCNLRIKKLEEAEVDWDEEDDSSYMKMQRYRRRCIDIHRKLVELKGVRDDAIKRRTRVASACPYPLVRTAIERYVYMKSSFPDFSDVVKIYQEANVPGLRSSELKCEAEKTFKEIGDQIQRDRQVYDWNLACSFLDNTSDPAENDSELRLQLQHNKQLGDSKLDEVMASFTRKQYEQHLEPTEVPDELAAATDDDDDDEDDDEDKGLSDDDVRDGLNDVGGDATDSDSDSNRGLTSNGCKTQSHGEKTENESKNDKKNQAGSAETKSSKSSSRSKKKSSGNLWSYTEDAKMNASTKKLPVKENSLKTRNTVVSKPLRTILPALQPGQTFLPTQTLLPVQIIMPAQTQLFSIGPMPSQTQQNYTTGNVGNPLRKYQMEALTNYLEMKYQMDPSSIKAKCVSSSIETTSLEQPASATGVKADSTESKAESRYEKTGSDPEVTSTSVDVEILLDSQAREIDRVPTGVASSERFEKSQAATNSSTARKRLVSGDSFGESHRASDNVSARSHLASDYSSTKGQIASNDLTAKSHLTIKEQASEAKSKGKSHKPSFSEVHSSYVLNRKCEKVDWAADEEDKFLSNDSWNDIEGKELGKICRSESRDRRNVKESGDTSGDADVSTKEDVPKLFDTKQADSDAKEESGAEEDTIVAEEVTEEGMSLNKSTVELEDWENMIVPTIVVKEVLLVPTDADGEAEGTEIETTAEVDLDSSDEYIQRSPTIKTFQRKGRNIVETSNKLAVKMHTEPSELNKRLPEHIVSPPSMAMIDRRSVKTPLVKENSDSAMHSAESSSSTSPVLDCGGGENMQEAKRSCDPTDQENVPPRKIPAEKAASKGVTSVVKSKLKIRGTAKNLKVGRDGVTASGAGCSVSSGLSESGVQESEEIAFVTSLDRATSVSPSCLPCVLPWKPTARKTATGRGIVIRTKKPVEHSEPDLIMNPVTKRYSKRNQVPEVVDVEPERAASVSSAPVSRRQLKPTARKSFPGEGPGGSQYKTWTVEKLKEETILTWAGKLSVESSVTNEPDVIVIDSD